jgi:hypothetical protein
VTRFCFFTSHLAAISNLVPKGRDEDGLAFTMSWLRHHDRYANGYLADPDKPYWPTDAHARAGRLEHWKTE